MPFSIHHRSWIIFSGELSKDAQLVPTCLSQWLDSARVVQQLVALIDPSCSEDHHSNAAEALCEMIKLSREQMSLLQEKAPADPLLESLES